MYEQIYVYALHVFPVSSSVTNATATLDTPNDYRTLHTITVNCTINLDSAADMCEVTVTANGLTLNGNCLFVKLNTQLLHMCTYVCNYPCTYVGTYAYIYNNIGIIVSKHKNYFNMQYIF